jgi:Fe-Mn family superoxide dismutase
MNNDAASMAPPMALALAASFGSVERWRSGFEALLRAGSACLCFVPSQGRLLNGGEPERGHVVLARRGSADASRPIDWGAVYERYQHAVHDASEALGVDAEAIGDALLFDVRRAGVYEEADSRIPGARWRDPALVSQWAAALPSARRVVVYCVLGHEVGRSTALRLRAQGISAQFLRGGIEGWKAEGRPLASKEDGQ